VNGLEQRTLLRWLVRHGTSVNNSTSSGLLFHNADIEFPGYLSLSQKLKFSDIPNGLYGITKVRVDRRLSRLPRLLGGINHHRGLLLSSPFQVPAAGIAQILLLTGLIEMAWWPASKYDGDYGCGFFGAKFEPEKKTIKLQAEMANGRLAMLGIAGAMYAEGQTGLTLKEQLATGNLIAF